MKGGDEIKEKMQKGVSECKIFVCCLSQSYLKSENCKFELEYALKLKKVIIPLKVSTDY